MSFRPRYYIVMAILVAMLSTPACTSPGSVQPVGEKPVVQIVPPGTDTQFAPGETVTVRVVAADPKGIARVELLAGDTPVAVHDLPQPVPTWQGELAWTAPSPGTYTLLVRVTNVAGATSDPAVFGVQVAGPGTPVAQPSATPVPGAPTRPPGVPTGVPTAVGPTAPPTAVGPTAPPTAVGPTAPPTAVGPTAPPTAVGPTAPPTAVGPTAVGPTAVGPTAVGPTAVGPTAVGPTAVGPTAVGPTAVGPTAPPTQLPTTPPS